MKTRQNKDWSQLHLNLGYDLYSEIQRRGDTNANFEALSRSLRREIKADETFLFWNALVGREEHHYSNTKKPTEFVSPALA